MELTAAETAEVWAERIAGYDASHSAAICIAQCDDILVGMSGIGRGHWPKTHHSSTLWGVYAKLEWRGLHIGKAVVNGCLDWAKVSGVTIVKLGVNITNTVAIQRYKHCGFTEYGVEPRVICVNGVYHDELLMVKLL